MSRHLVRSFILASVLGPFVNAGPCKPLSSSTILVLTTTESTEIGIASSSTDIAVSTSETYTLSSRSEDVSTTTAESLSGTVSESVLFTTTAETSAISSDDTTVSQGETTTTAVFESSTTAASDLASDITTLTSEAPTTTTTEDVTLTSTEPSETTTEAGSSCKYDKRNPLPKNLLCGQMGYSSGATTANAVLLGNGRYGTELECLEDCVKNPDCKLLIVMTGDGGFCELWSKVFSPSGGPTPFKWYEPGCFCDSYEPEPETTTTQAPEVLPTTTDMTSETGSPTTTATDITSETKLPTTTTTEDVTLTSTEPEATQEPEP